jgi:hypothetical protein
MPGHAVLELQPLERDAVLETVDAAMPSPTWRTLPTSEEVGLDVELLIRSLRIEVISSGLSFKASPY